MQRRGCRTMLWTWVVFELETGQSYALFDVSEDMGHRSKITKLGEIFGIGCLGETLLPKWIASTLEKIPPGRAVGYLPAKHDVDELTTIHDYLIFLGGIHKMSANLILQRFRALSEPLQLPHERSSFGSIPCTDVRRVDLAAALIHSPSLLIIDEPSWEQDASSQEKIRNFLTTLTRDDDVTVLLLTAHPDAAGHADVVGIFDQGRLIAEDSPDRLLHEFKCGTLGEVFRKLQDGQRGKVVRHGERGEAVMEDCHQTAWETEPKKAPLCKASYGMEFTSASKAVTGSSIGLTEQLKMLLDLWRRILLLIAFKNIILEFPTTLSRLLWVQFILLSCFYFICPLDGSETLAVVKSGGNSTLAESFLDSLPKDRIHQQPYSHRLEALASMKRGETFAVMEIGRNFTTAPHYRFQCIFATEDNQTSHSSTLDIDLETIDQETRFVWLQEIFIDGPKDFQRNIVKAKNASHAQVNLEIRDPVYGSRFISRFEFLAHRLLIQVPFWTTMVHAAFQTHVNSYVINTRLALAGVTPFEIIVSTLLPLLFFLLLRTAGLLVCIFLLYWGSLLSLEGSLTLVICLILEQGLRGMAVGLTIASACLPVRTKTGQEVFERFFQFCTLFSASILIYVALLPHHVIPDIIRRMRYYFLPTSSTESLFYIMFRGLGLEKKEVAIGFTGLGPWTGFFAFFVALYVLCLSCLTIPWFRRSVGLQRQRVSVGRAADPCLDTAPSTRISSRLICAHDGISTLIRVSLENHASKGEIPMDELPR